MFLMWIAGAWLGANVAVVALLVALSASVADDVTRRFRPARPDNPPPPAHAL